MVAMKSSTYGALSFISWSTLLQVKLSRDDFVSFLQTCKTDEACFLTHRSRHCWSISFRKWYFMVDFTLGKSITALAISVGNFVSKAYNSLRISSLFKGWLPLSVSWWKQNKSFNLDLTNRQIKANHSVLYGYPCEWARIWTNISLDTVISYWSANGKDGSILCRKNFFSSTKLGIQASFCLVCSLTSNAYKYKSLQDFEGQLSLEFLPLSQGWVVSHSQ